MTDSVVVRKYREEDYDSWRPLWLANNRGKCNEKITAETWRRLMEPDGQVKGMGAWLEGRMSGICHYVIHPTTGAIEPVCYMQDLFVDPTSRRRGLAKALIMELELEGRRHKWKRIYWLAETKNEAATKLYENIGVKLDFSFYVLPLA